MAADCSMCIWVQILVVTLPFLAQACRWLWWDGPLPILAEGPVGAVPHQSWLGPAAGFGGVGGPSPILPGALWA